MERRVRGERERERERERGREKVRGCISRREANALFVDVGGTGKQTLIRWVRGGGRERERERERERGEREREREG